MEKIASDLSVSEAMQRNLSRAHEAVQLQSQASSMISFTCQWMDLSNHFDSTRNALQTRFEELKDSDNELKSLEAKKSKLNSEIHSKISELRAIEKENEDKTNESKQLEGKISELNSEIESKISEFAEIDKLTDDKGKEAKDTEHYLVVLSQVIAGKEKELSEMIKVKLEQLSMVEKLTKEKENDFHLKSKEFDRRLKSKEEKVKSKLAESKEELRGVQKSSNKGQELREEGQEEQSLGEGSTELRSKEEIKREMELKLKAYSLRKKPLEEWSSELQNRERELESREKEVKALEDILQEREKSFHTLENLLEDRVKQLDSQSERLKAKVGQLQEQSRQLVEKIEELDVKKEIVDGRGLQLFMYEHMKRNYSVSYEISTLLQQKSSEPARLVLDAMKGFYPSEANVDHNDLVLVRRTCILLLEELKRVSPKISVPLKEEAMKLASDWKAKMKMGNGNWLETLGFLRLVAAYELKSSFDAKELQSLLNFVAQYEQATELSRVLGSTTSTDKEHGQSNDDLAPVKIKKPDSPPVQNSQQEQATKISDQALVTTTDKAPGQSNNVVCADSPPVQDSTSKESNKRKMKSFEASSLSSPIVYPNAAAAAAANTPILQDQNKRFCRNIAPRFHQGGGPHESWRRDYPNQGQSYYQQFVPPPVNHYPFRFDMRAANNAVRYPYYQPHRPPYM